MKKLLKKHRDWNTLCNDLAKSKQIKKTVIMKEEFKIIKLKK